MTTTDTAGVALALSTIATLGSMLTGDALMSVLTIGASALRLALAHRNRPRPGNVYRARFAALRTRLARLAFRVAYRPDPSGYGFVPRTRLTHLAHRAMLAP